MLRNTLTKFPGVATAWRVSHADILEEKCLNKMNFCTLWTVICDKFCILLPYVHKKIFLQPSDDERNMNFYVLFFIFLLSTMKHIMNGHIRERKENTIVFLFIQHPFLAMKVLHLTEHNFYELHIGVYNWRVLVVRWLFILFS